MLKECFRVRSQITALGVLEDDSIAFSTKLHGVKIFSSLECNVTKNLSIELLGHQTTAVSISSCSSLLAFCNSNIIYIFDLKNKILLHTIRTSSKRIDIIAFRPYSKYLLTGDNEGRVTQYRYDGKSQLSRLCSFGYSDSQRPVKENSNYVSAFAFHDEYVASSGYGGVITVQKMNSHANRFNIEASKVRINALCFLNSDSLMSGNIDGTLQIHSLKKHQPTKIIDTPFVNIKEILLMPCKKYVLVSGESNKLILVNLSSAKIASTSYLEFQDDVQKIVLAQDNKLFVVLQNKQFLKVELPTVEDIKSLILHNSIDEALILIEKEPMLQGTREHKRVEVLYEKLYTQAINALVNADKKEARRIIEMFENVESKKDDINSIFKAFEYYPRFKILFLDKKYALAYAMTQKFPALTHTREYKKMEEVFKETFNFAQKQVLIGREDIAKEILSVYASVLSKKPILNLILNQNKAFIEFLKAIEAKNYASIDKLVKINKTFAEIPTYKALKKSTQNSLDSISNFISKGELPKAKKLLVQVASTPDTKEEIQFLKRKYLLAEDLYLAYEQSDFRTCYEIIDTNHSLDELELTQLLEKHWAKIMDGCEVHALKGNIKEIKHLLGELIHVSSRIAKIGDLIRLSFYTKIKILLAKRSYKSAQSIIYSYIDTFGEDSEITLLMKTYERVSSKKLAITSSDTKKISRDDWIKSSLIMKS